MQPTCRMPFARKKVEYEHDRLQQQDIIEPAQGPSLWVQLLHFLNLANLTKLDCV